MKKSESISKIMPALLKAQTAMGGAKKGASNPFFKSKYADLGAVLEACKDLLNENGISILQPHSNSCVETYLIHESGEFIGGETPIVCAKQNDPQALGSAITYARRYGLQSLLSLPAEDDDGESAMDRRSLRKEKVDAKEAESETDTGEVSKVAAMGRVPKKSGETISAPAADRDTQPAAPPKERSTLNNMIGEMASVAIKQKKKTLEEIRAHMKEKYQVEKKEDLNDVQAQGFYTYLRGIIYG